MSAKITADASADGNGTNAANAWQLERIAEGITAARDGRVLPADEVFQGTGLKHRWITKAARRQ